MKPLFLLLSALALALAGCSKSAPPSNAAASAPASSSPTSVSGAPHFPGMEADLQNTLKAQKDFYEFKPASDFDKDTAGLKWDDSSDLPEFSSPDAKPGGTLNLYLPDYPGTFRTVGPNSNDAFRSFLLDYDAMNYLDIHPNYPGRYIPQLVTAWAADPQHKTVYFRLDPNARWSDGAPVTTDDVVFSFYFQRSPYLNDPWYNDFYTKTYSRLTVYDAHSFAISVPELRPDFVYRAGNIAPYPKHFFAEFGPGWEQKYNWRVCPTTGAYTINPGDAKQQVSLTMTHVPHWWAENKRFMRHRYNPEKVHFVVIHDSGKVLEELVHGDIDDYLVPEKQWFDRLTDDSPSVASGFTVKATVYNQVPVPDWGLFINESKPILSNRDVRVGIQYASNFDLICKEYFHNLAVRQETANDGYGWDLNPAVRARRFDPQKARQAFARAGFTIQGPDGILQSADGRRLSFTITNCYRRYEDLLTILKQEAVKAGLEFIIESPDQTTAYKITEDKRHEITFLAWQKTVEMFPRYWEDYDGVNAYDTPYLADGKTPNPNRKPKPNTNNLSCVAIPELDDIIARYETTTTMAELKPLAARAEQIIFDDANWVPGWKLPMFFMAYRPWVHWPPDFVPMQALDGVQYWTMWIDQDEKARDLEARANGRPLPKQVLIYDQHKAP